MRVDHRAHRRAGAGDGAEHAGDGVADALADQLAVGVVVGLGHVVGDQRGQQAVDRAEQRQHQRRLDHVRQGCHAEARQYRARQAGRDRAENRRAGQRDQHQYGAEHQGDQRRRYDPVDRVGCQIDDTEREQTDDRGVQPGRAQQGRQAGQCRQRSAVRCCVTDQGAELQNDDDAADAAHEAGDHRKRHQADVAADLEDAEQDMKHAGQHDHGEGHRRFVTVLGDDSGHDDRHRPGRARYLRRCAAEQRREEADEDRAVQAGDRPGAGRDTERQGEWQATTAAVSPP